MKWDWPAWEPTSSSSLSLFIPKQSLSTWGLLTFPPDNYLLWAGGGDAVLCDAASQDIFERFSIPPVPRRTILFSLRTKWLCNLRNYVNSHEYVIFVVVQSQSCVWLLVTLWTSAHQASHPSPSPRVCSDSCPLSPWCHPTISSSVTSFSSCPESFPAPGFFPVSWLFRSGGQSIGVSASVLPMNIQGWFPLGLNGLISLFFKVFSRVFSSPTIRKY